MNLKIYSKVLVISLTALQIVPAQSVPSFKNETNPLKNILEQAKRKSKETIINAADSSKRTLDEATEKFSLTNRDLLQGAAIGSTLIGASFLTQDPKLQWTLRTLAVVPMLIGIFAPKKLIKKVSKLEIENKVLCPNDACKGVCSQCRVTKAYFAALPLGFLYYGLSWLFTPRPITPMPEVNNNTAPIHPEDLPVEAQQNEELNQNELHVQPNVNADENDENMESEEHNEVNAAEQARNNNINQDNNDNDVLYVMEEVPVETKEDYLLENTEPEEKSIAQNNNDEEEGWGTTLDAIGEPVVNYFSSFWSQEEKNEQSEEVSERTEEERKENLLRTANILGEALLKQDEENENNSAVEVNGKEKEEEEIIEEQRIQSNDNSLVLEEASENVQSNVESEEEHNISEDSVVEAKEKKNGWINWIWGADQQSEESEESTTEETNTGWFGTPW